MCRQVLLKYLIIPLAKTYVERVTYATCDFDFEWSDLPAQNHVALPRNLTGWFWEKDIKYTVEPLLKDSPNKGHHINYLPTKDTF